MTSLLTPNVLLFAGECLAGSVVLLGFAAIATSLLKTAALRHFVWLTAFGAMLMLPVAAFVVPSQIVVHHKAAAAAPATQDDASLPVYTPSGSAVPETGVDPAVSPAPAWKIDAHTIALGLLVLWLAGFGCALLRLLFGAIGVNALQLSSVPVPEDELSSLPEDCADCELRIADDNRGPLTWGFLRPVILLPREAAEWSRERLRAVLLHEMAHVRRGDSFAQAVSLIACALYWPNPLAWIGARLMRREAEMAADDEVLNAGVRPSDYAGELLQLAAEYRGASFAGLSMASRPALEDRVKSILAANPFRRGVRSMDILKIAGFGLVATAALAFARPTFAEDAPQPPAPPPAVSQAELPPLPPPPPAVSQTELPPLPPAPPALAENDVPAPQNPPGVPDAPAAPPAPPAPPAAAAPAAPAAPAADADAASGHDIIIDEPHHHLHIHTGQAMSAADRAKLHEILRNVHTEVRAAMEKARPDMERARAELRAHRDEMKNLRPQIEKAMHDAGPDMERAMAELRAHRAEMEKIRPQIEQAMREARPEIEHAMATAREELEKAKLDEKTKSHVERVLERVQARMDAAHQRHLVIVQRHDGRQAVNSDQNADNDHDSDNDHDADKDHDAHGAHDADNDHDMDNDHDTDNDDDNDEDSGGDHTSVNAPHPRQ